MAKYRHQLPQSNGSLFLTDGGIETTLIFHDGIDLPYFAAFDLFKTREGTESLRRYFSRYAEIARQNGTGFIFESATWRASPDWAEKLGYSPADLAEANHRSIDLLVGLRDAFESHSSPMVISGCVGPRGDGYDPGDVMTPDEAHAYHAVQIDTFATTMADQVTAITMTNVDEAIGLTRAAQKAGMPVVISFTVETDGNLPTGQSLRDAIGQVDAETGQGPAYFMINCAHPTHFDSVLESASWMERVRGLRTNASKCSHAELDEAEELDDGNPAELGAECASIRARFPSINVLGGCCGTDHRHIEQICGAVRQAA